MPESARSITTWRTSLLDPGPVKAMAEVERRTGIKLAAAKPFRFTSTGDRYGWAESEDGLHHLTLFLGSLLLRAEQQEVENHRHKHERRELNQHVGRPQRGRPADLGEGRRDEQGGRLRRRAE